MDRRRFCRRTVAGVAGVAIGTNAATADDSVDLSTAGDADFDLYVTTDGRHPSRSDYDHAGRSFGGDEFVAIPAEEQTDGQRIAVLVHAYQGSGQYSLQIAER